MARRLPSLGVGAWRCAPLLPWRVQCPVCVCAALAAGSGGSDRYLASCLSRFPLPASRIPRCVWGAVLSGCPLASLAGTPFHAVRAFRALGPVALPVVPACLFRVCALALSRCPLPPPLGGVACASRVVPALGAGRAVPRGPCPSTCPAPVPCSVWRAWGGAVRSRFPPTWLGVVGVAAGRPRGGCLLPLRGASGVMRSPSPDCPPTGRAVGVRDPRVVGAGVRVWGPCSVPVGAARRGAGPWRSHAGGRARGGGGGVRRTPRLCGRGGACRAGGRSASFRPSAFPGRATKRASLALCCPWGAWPPIPLRFVLTRLLWVRSVRRPGAQRWARLFFAAPMGAGGWGGGAGRTPAPLSGGGGPSPLPRGVGAGAPAACGPVGGRGGGCRAAASLLSFRAAACGTPSWPPPCRRRVPFRRARAVGAEVPPRVGGGVRGGPWTAPPGALADLNPPSVIPEWAVVTRGLCGARPPSYSVVRVAPARRCGFAGAGPAAAPPSASPSLLGGGGAPPRPRGGGGPRLWLPSWGWCGGGLGGPPPRALSGLCGRGGGGGGGPFVRLSCNLYSRFFQCKILIHVHPQKTTIPALFWTVLVPVDQEFL